MDGRPYDLRQDRLAGGRQEGTPGSGGPPAPYEKRELTTGNIIGEALHLYRRFFLRFFGIALAVFLAVDLVSALATVANSDTARGIWLVLAVIASVVGFFGVQGALVVTADDVRDGRADLSARQVYARARERLPFLVATGFLVGVVSAVTAAILILAGRAAGMTWLGILAAVVLALVLFTRWTLATPLVMLEDHGPVAALKASNRLVRGHSWRVFGIIILSGFMAGIASAVVSGILTRALSGFLEAWLTASVSNALTAPFLALAWTLVYFHLRPVPESTSGSES